MSEELTPLPCPACGNPNVVVNVTTRAAVHCPDCGMYGPCAPTFSKEYAIRQWNSLLRALEWTNEPHLGAWNWWRDEYGCIPRYVYQDGTVAITMLMVRVPYQDLGGQWAGPIPEPREPKESVCPGK